VASDLQTRKYPFTLQQGETVLQVLRRHWLHVWPKLILMFLAMVLPIVLLWFVLDWIDVRDDDIGRYVGIILSALWAAFWLVRMFLTWYAYSHDMWVITDQRLVDVRKPNPIKLELASADMTDVLDMSVERSGLLGTMFNFGDVRCQTAGTATNFILAGVPDPAGVQAVIDKTRDDARGGVSRRYPQQHAQDEPPPPPEEPRSTRGTRPRPPTAS
jgi:hypothetical protein